MFAIPLGDISLSIGFGIFVWFYSLMFRLSCLHIFGSLILKKRLMVQKAGAALMGFSDFILAIFWAFIWAWIDPQGPAADLFPMQNNSSLSFNPFWIIVYLPIAFGSAMFRFLFGKEINKYRESHISF